MISLNSIRLICDYSKLFGLYTSPDFVVSRAVMTALTLADFWKNSP